MRKALDKKNSPKSWVSAKALSAFGKMDKEALPWAICLPLQIIFMYQSIILQD